ncbi:MAG: hypothetical protein KDM63_04395 [Verrucomicrobiae bacterium]|nr:hypothetical protein [Verrucomicrobiae bacterium]
MNETPPQLPPDLEYQPPAQPEAMSAGAKWGIGCSIGCLLTLLIAGALLYVGYVKVKDLASGLLNQYTSETPLVFQAPEADSAEIESLMLRANTFGDAMKSGTDAPSLELTARDINLLIHHHPDWKEMANRAEVVIEGDQLTAQISLPLDEMSKVLKGRFLNGKATIRLVLANGILEGYLDDLEVANQKLPPELMSEFKDKNLFDDPSKRPQLEQMTRDFQELKIQGGRLIIVPKPASERAPKSAPPTAEAPPKAA